MTLAEALRARAWRAYASGDTSASAAYYDAAALAEATE